MGDLVGKLYAYRRCRMVCRALRRAVRWRFIAENDVVASPIVADDTVLVTGGDGRLYALHRDEGRERWRFQTA